MNFKRLPTSAIIFFLFASLLFFGFTTPEWHPNYGQVNAYPEDWQAPMLWLANDSVEPDSLPYPFRPGQQGGLFGSDPSNITTEVVYDPENNQYLIYKKIGDNIVGSPEVLSPSEYRQRMFEQQGSDYWQERVEETKRKPDDDDDDRTSQGLIPQIQVGSELFSRIFGGSSIEVKPQGMAELTFGGRYQKIDNPMISERNRSIFNFNFQQRIQMNVNGRIGEKLLFSTNYDTDATFNFENRMKVEFKGDEDDIIKHLEMGNVNLPVNSALITGAQSLFGLKTQMQFGKTTITAVVSEQRSQSKSINVEGGGTVQDFEIWADEYEANRHFFLGHYFRNHYEEALKTMPVVNSPIVIQRIEVWITNRRSQSEEVRNLIAFMDLGETEEDAFRNPDRGLTGISLFPQTPVQGGFPDNRNNNLNPPDLTANYTGIRDIGAVSTVLEAAGMENSIEFIELANARKLQQNQFTFHPQLGYISLNQPLNQDEVLAVAYQYTANGRTYQVGEFSNDGVSPPKNLVVKMLKSAVLDVRTPIWDLMMKNVYSLNGFGIDKQNFRFNVLYMNDETGVPIPFLPRGNLSNELLVRVMELDRVNQNNDPQPDGMFDFVPGITINPQNGRIFFPVVEPFGSNLAAKLTDPDIRNQYVFQELYDSTRFRAQEQTRKNKFLMRGQYQSASGAEIPLGAFNVPRGSVSVTAGGVKLVENQDYTVDYSLGRVRIINEGLLSSGTPIRVDFENNTMFNLTNRSFMGMTFDHRVNRNLNVGGSFLRMSERPITEKTNMGDEPIANTIWGLNTTYQNEAPWLTRLVDRIPGLNTKEKSSIQVQGEMAHLIPGSPRGIKFDGSETTFIDDFENTQMLIDIRGFLAWQLASTPAGQPDIFPEGGLTNQLEYGYNRAKIAWYTIDPMFYSSNQQTPANIRGNSAITSNHYQRQILIEEVFPNREVPTNMPRNIATLDLAYYPEERGPYNFDVEGFPGISAGIDADGSLLDPASRWGGIMRPLQINNFEEQNIEFVQFWVLDPFLEDPNLEGGDLYLNLGNVSEDILKDGRQFFENGIPPDGDESKVDQTVWGLVPKVQPLVEAFDNEPNARAAQDVGFDGLNDDQERSWDFGQQLTYLQRLSNQFGTGSGAYITANQDPAADNFQYYRGQNLDDNDANILERYKDFNNPQGNSSTESINGFPAAATNMPDKEDANRDQTLNKTEAYYQYKISMRRQDLEVGRNYITDIREVQTPELPDGSRKTARWIQFKVPIFEPEKRIGSINDFRSIRFVRMFMKNFENPIVLRFARLDLVRGEWRRYMFSLDDVREEVPVDIDDPTIFNVNAVNLEENGNRNPIPYVIPPGINRQRLFQGTTLIQQNEQAMSLYVCGLRDGDARAVFKVINMDMRMYNRLKMFVHAEAGSSEAILNDNDLSLFIRLGSDYNLNFYEYEIPLKVTPFGATNPYAIWPEENNMDLDLQMIREVKLERDRRVVSDPDFTRANRFTVNRGEATVSVVGSPNLSNVRTMMIGVRNPKKRSQGDGDDGMDKCAEVWVNELRLSDFDNRGGWAANARVTAKLADFGNVAVTGYYSSVGFGSIDQRVNERNQFSQHSYDLQSNFELGKFLPDESGIKIPVFFGYAEDWKTPMFNPLDPDIEFSDAIANIENPGARDSLRKASQDYTLRKSFNVTNLRKERRATSQKSPKPWNIENFSASYSFSEIFRRDINTEFDRRAEHRASLNYQFQNRPKNVQPFKSIKSKHLALIKDFNFYYMPQRFTFRTELGRINAEAKQRNTDNFFFELPTTYDKTFTLNRNYALFYDITKALKVDFNARMNTWIDELPGPARSEENQAEIRRNLENFGRPVQYNQSLNINWQVPINKLPLMDFTTVSARYTGNFDWRAASRLAQDPQSEVYFGNIIENSQNIQVNGQLNFVNLYNKVPYLQKINSPKPPAGRGAPQRPRGGPEQPGEGEKKEEKEKEDKPSIFEEILKGTLRITMGLRNVTGNYSENRGTMLPGFLPQPYFFGVNEAANYGPGWDYVFGLQPDIRSRAAQNSLDPMTGEYLEGGNPWLTNRAGLPQQFSQIVTKNLGYNATFEPINDLRIDFKGTLTEGENLSSFFILDTAFGGYRDNSLQRTGNFSMSFIAISTHFETSNASNNYQSNAYDNFREYRLIISRRLANEMASINDSYTPQMLPNAGEDSSRYGYIGYSVVSSDVLIPAFLAAYGGIDPEKVSLNSIPETRIPVPNWNLTYNGLMRLGWFKKTFTNFALNHGYQSTYSIMNYQENLQRQELIEDGTQYPLNPNFDFFPMFQIPQVTISERFSPLIGFNMRMKNNATFKVDIGRGRMLGMSTVNNQITETREYQITVGAGYVLKDVKFNFIRVGASKKPVSSNLELRTDISIRDNQTVIRRILEDVNQITTGNRIVTVGVSADYRISARVSARLFYDHNVSTFKTSNAFPTITGNGGLSVRLNLGQ